MSDRLEEIKRHWHGLGGDDVPWLIAEVERLRAALDSTTPWTVARNTFEAEVVALRTALRNLYDATELGAKSDVTNWVGQFHAARGAAGRLLNSPEASE